MGERRHGHAPRRGVSVEYDAWRSMIQRCTNPARKDFDRYGGRGIRVCEEWNAPEGFSRFLAHVGPRPSTAHSIDRFPNMDGNYEPGNVRWATREEQNNNRSNNRVLSFRGERRTMSEWARIVGLSVQTISERLRAGWSVERSLMARPARYGMLTFRGQTKPLKTWCRLLDLNVGTVRGRIRRGWSSERAFTQKPTPGMSGRPQCGRGAKTTVTP